MNTNANVVANFKDKYGETRQIHHTRHGLKVKRKGITVQHAFTKVISEYIGAKIKEKRIELGMTLEDLCVMSGLASSTPKSRMWEIENVIREGGIKFGTIYCIANALGCEVNDLIPSVTEAKELAGIKDINIKTIG